MKSVIPIIILAVIVYVIYRAVQANKAETSEERTIKSLPPTVQHTVAQMDLNSQNAFFNEYEKKKKKVAIGYVLWIIGFHYLYLKKVGVQFAFWFTGGGFLVWWFIDLFRMPSLVRSANEGTARDALQTLAIGNQFKASAPQTQTQVQPQPEQF